MIITNYSTKIGIARLLAIIGVEENYKDVAELNGYISDYCTRVGCDTFNLINTLDDNSLKNDIINNYCLRNCPNSNKKITIYRNEKNFYKIKDVLLLSKSRLQQYIYYHSLCDSYGGVFKLSFKQMRETLNYSERTLKENNKFFVDNNLICLSKINSEYFNLFITGYKDYFKSKEDYGRGYVEISREVVFLLLKATNVNDVRLTIRRLIESCKQNRFYVCSYNYVKHTFEELKRFLPSYINCPKKINDFIANSKIKIFNTKITDDAIEYILKDQFDIKKIKAVKEDDIRFAITGHILKQSRNLGWKIIGLPIEDIYEITNIKDYLDDFVQMAIQYDLKIVLYAIDYLLGIILRDEFNGNYGAAVRNRIKDTIYRQAI